MSGIDVPLEYLIPAVLAVLAVLLGVGVIWWRRRKPTLDSVLKGVAVKFMHDVVLPDGMGGQIHVEYLLLTAGGMLVVDVKRFEGTIFASDRMDDWTVISQEGRFAFPNPQVTLYDRVAAVKRFVRDVPVVGYVLFPSAADFSKGRPNDVILPGELAERFKKPERNEIERLMEAFSVHWERVRDAAEPSRPTSS